MICTGQFMVVLDVSIVNVALPSIQDDLGFSEADLQWVISAYTLMAGGFLLLGGRVADIAGRRLIFTWSEAALIVARAIQGLGAAFVAPAALSRKPVPRLAIMRLRNRR